MACFESVLRLYGLILRKNDVLIGTAAAVPLKPANGIQPRNGIRTMNTQNRTTKLTHNSTTRAQTSPHAAFTRRALAALAAAGLTLSACGGPDVEVGQTEAAASGALCNDRVGLWALAGDLLGVVPGLGMLGKIAASTTKISERLACGGSPGVVGASINDIHKHIAASKRDEYESDVKSVMNDLRTPKTLKYSELGNRITRIKGIEARGTAVGWASIHTKAQLAALKYGFLLLKLEKTLGASARAEAASEIENELKLSIDELDRVEQDYLDWANRSISVRVIETKVDNSIQRNYRGEARLDDIVRTAMAVSCVNVFKACKKKENQAMDRGNALKPEVLRAHRDRVFTPEYQKLRAQLDAARAHYQYRSPRNECRIKNFWRGSFLKYTSTGPVMAQPTWDPKQASYYATTFVVEESKKGAVTLRSGYFYSDLSKEHRMLTVETTGSQTDFDAYLSTSVPGQWIIERVGAEAPAHVTTALYRIRPKSRPTDALHIENGAVEVGAASPGWHSSFWSFEGPCGRIMKSDGDVADEDTELERMANASGLATRIRNLGRPNLELGMDYTSGSAEKLILADMSVTPDVDIFHFSPVNPNDRSLSNMQLRHTYYDHLYVQPSTGSRLDFSSTPHPVGSTFALRRITGNVFSIVNKQTNQYVKAGNGVLVMGSSFDDTAKWVFEDVNGSYGKVGIEMAGFAGKCLDLDAGNTSNGTSLQLWNCIDSGSALRNQEFELLERSPGRYEVVHRASGKCLDVDAGGWNNGTRLQLWTCQQGNLNQEFAIRFKATTYAKTAFQMVSLRNHKCVDMSGNTSNGTKMQFWDCASTNDQGGGHPNQLFTFRFR